MLNYVWAVMLITGFLVGIMNGKAHLVTQAAISSAKDAIELCIGLLGVMCLWTGLMNVAEKSGLVRYISRLIRPAVKFLFPGIPERHPAIAAIVMNFTANFLGLGNAATPLGLKAMNEMQKLNARKETATDSMCMFLVLNTSAIQLVPATIIAVRSAAGSVNPSEIIVPIWLATICASIAGITSAKLLSKLHGK